MKHWRQENATKVTVHCTETIRRSCAGSVELPCARSTFEASAQALYWKDSVSCISFCLHSTLQRCYCVKDLCVHLLWLCVRVLSPVTLVKELNNTLICHWKPCCYFVKGELTQNKRCSCYMFEITLFFLFLIVSAQQMIRYYRKGICPVWAKHTTWARVHKNFIKITNFRI